jgi:hypothetical protein
MQVNPWAVPGASQRRSLSFQEHGFIDWRGLEALLTQELAQNSGKAL